jgi:hypothetical protein
MRAWFSCTGAELLALTLEAVASALAACQMARRLSGEPAQLHAWRQEVAVLQDAIRIAGGEAWTLALEYDLLRLEKRIDAVLLTDRAVIVLEFKVGATVIGNTDRAQAYDYAQDLHDFHAGSRRHPILPVVVATQCRAPAPFQPPLPVPGVLPVAEAGAAGLPGLLMALQDALGAPAEPIDGAAWCRAPYRPVPTIIEAAATLFARQQRRRDRRRTRRHHQPHADHRRDRERAWVRAAGGRTRGGLRHRHTRRRQDAVRAERRLRRFAP